MTPNLAGGCLRLTSQGDPTRSLQRWPGVWGQRPQGLAGVWGEAPGQGRWGEAPDRIDLPGGQAADRDDGRATRPGNGGHSPPRVSSTMAIRASGLWKPYATLVSNRTWVLVASLLALLKP